MMTHVVFWSGIGKYQDLPEERGLLKEEDGWGGVEVEERKEEQRPM